MKKKKLTIAELTFNQDTLGNLKEFDLFKFYNKDCYFYYQFICLIPSINAALVYNLRRDDFFVYRDILPVIHKTIYRASVEELNECNISLKFKQNV